MSKSETFIKISLKNQLSTSDKIPLFMKIRSLLSPIGNIGNISIVTTTENNFSYSADQPQIIQRSDKQKLPKINRFRRNPRIKKYL
jgi:hypothetical protein